MHLLKLLSSLFLVSLFLTNAAYSLAQDTTNASNDNHKIEVGLGAEYLDRNIMDKRFIFNSIHFELIAQEPLAPQWNVKNHTWEVVRPSSLWKDSQNNEGISGMNMSSICHSKYMGEESISATRAWSKLFMGETPKSNNTVIRTLKGIRDHGNL